MAHGPKKTDGDDQPVVPSVHWHAMTVEECLKELDCGSEVLKSGLTSEDAAKRLEEYGLNKMAEKVKKSLLERIWHHLNNILVYILAVVAIVSAVRAITADSGNNVVTNTIQVVIIVSVVSINTYIGLVQEGDAEKAAEALKNMLSSDARVMRDGKEIMIPSTDLVPGDLVLLGLGDKVPCDMRIIKSTNLACGEAALTGESVPIEKIIETIPVPANGNADQTPLGDRCNMTFSATLVAQGTGSGIAVTTGDHTQIGTINKLVSQVEDKRTAVLEQIDTVSKYLAVFIMICTIITFLVAFLYTGLGALDSISIALVAAVAMVPEGLEAIVTVTYAYAVSTMAKHNAIVRALPAVETLGSVTVICSDKTGTLTQNVMSLTAFVTSSARYQFDVNNKERTPSNFSRDDNFLTRRAKLRGKAAVSEPEIVETAFASTGEVPSADYIKKSLAGGILCSKCVLGSDGGRDGEIGNPTELSILRAAYFGGVDVEALKEEAPLFNEVPFSSEYKFMATVHEPSSIDGNGLDGKFVVHAKGAPDRMIPMCSHQAKGGNIHELEPVNEEFWLEQIAILSSHGLRVLALCRGTIGKSAISATEQLGAEFISGKGKWLTIVGLCAIIDPPRPECVSAIQDAHGAGVRVAMITGDHKDTALAIGDMLGLVDKKYSEAVTGPEMDNMSDDELRIAVMTHNVFARASPQNKIRIVKALQAEGQVCSMTGDGVNDAPALKAADMGVAMGLEGTDVAREASEMILADDNFATIVIAVREGRVVWDNLRKVLLVNTPINNAQGLSVLFGFAFGLKELPLTAIQVLYSNLICAVTLGFVCAVEPAEDGIMSLPPRRVGKRLIGRYLFLRIVLGTIILTSAVVGSSFIEQARGGDVRAMRTISFNTLDFGAIGITASARFAYNSSIHPRLFKNNNSLIYSIVIVTVTQVFITYVPGVNDTIFGMARNGMDGISWLICMSFSFGVFFVMEAEKAFRRVLRARGEDTDDREENEIFDEHVEPAPTGTKLLG
jgi:potassium/sodium efflux P-type ATPase